MTTKRTLSDAGFVSRMSWRDTGPGLNHSLAHISLEAGSGSIQVSAASTNHQSLVTNHCLSNRHTSELEIGATHCKQTTAASSNRHKTVVVSCLVGRKGPALHNTCHSAFSCPERSRRTTVRTNLRTETCKGTSNWHPSHPQIRAVSPSEPGCCSERSWLLWGFSPDAVVSGTIARPKLLDAGECNRDEQLAHHAGPMTRTSLSGKSAPTPRIAECEFREMFVGR
jgi:hypothetical protein